MRLLEGSLVLEVRVKQGVYWLVRIACSCRVEPNRVAAREGIDPCAAQTLPSPLGETISLKNRRRAVSLNVNLDDLSRRLFQSVGAPDRTYS
ncbi:unnamed protein product [Parnassius apollo]|uniref:(apollo) hypothetical protein n=1 Tax=Parnassius apollo TaxID=110799 RepID=A0A8S3WA53_PARAO|nr:unnamed protein product [Parnassius apollo]